MEIKNIDLDLLIIYVKSSSLSKVILQKTEMGYVFPYCFDKDHISFAKDEFKLDIKNEEDNLVHEFIFNYDYQVAKMSKTQFYKTYNCDVIVCMCNCYSYQIDQREFLYYDTKKYLNVDYFDETFAFRTLINNDLKTALKKALDKSI